MESYSSSPVINETNITNDKLRKSVQENVNKKTVNYTNLKDQHMNNTFLKENSLPAIDQIVSESLLENFSQDSVGNTTCKIEENNQGSCSDDEQQANMEDIKDPALLFEEQRYKCEHCAYSTQEKYRIVSHMRKHTGEKPFSCSQCSFTCAHYATLRNHKFLHGEKKYNCDLCGHKSAILSTHRNHMQLVHSEERNFPCSQCPYKGKTKKTLASHVRTHSPPLKCPHCDHKCARKEQYIIHVGTHARDLGQEGSFECILCDYKGYTPYCITRHMKESHGEFECDVCGEVFEGKVKLKEHKEIHIMKRFLCDQCGHAMTTSDRLKRHIREKHELDASNIKKCPHCFKKFVKGNSYYNAHLKTHENTCKICNLDFKTKINLNWHNKNLHSTEGNSKTNIQ